MCVFVVFVLDVFVVRVFRFLLFALFELCCECFCFVCGLIYVVVLLLCLWVGVVLSLCLFRVIIVMCCFVVSLTSVDVDYMYMGVKLLYIHMNLFIGCGIVFLCFDCLYGLCVCLICVSLFLICGFAVIFLMSRMYTCICL